MKTKRAERRKYHYLYKTTCTKTGRYYVGMHSTDDLDDGYLGSGIRFQRSLAKHGPENHDKEILEFLPTRADLRSREAEVVNEILLKDPHCMNIARGGEGGWDYVNEQHLQPKAGHKSFPLILEALSRGNKHPGRQEACIKNLGDGMKGKCHSQETRIKMSESHRGSNGQMWITNKKTGEQRRLIRIEALRMLASDEWTAGRKK